jgi:hypothetical protein
MPSTGQGIELGWADAANVPIIALYEAGSDYSKSAGHLAKEMHQYTTVEDMISRIQAFIQSNTRHV